MAVWVGYPDELRPMLTEFDGEAVAGGTLPAQIWKAFMTAAAKQLETPPEQFAGTPYLPAQQKRIVWRNGAYRLDNGYCPGTRVVAYFADRGPSTQAQCYANEVTVPLVSARRSTPRTQTLAAQPLGSERDRRPDEGRQAPGLRGQAGATNGFLSANGTVRLYVTGPTRVTACFRTSSARASSSRRSACWRSRRRRRSPTRKVPRARCWSRRPLPGVAAGRGLKVTLLVGRAKATHSPYDVSPR